MNPVARRSALCAAISLLLSPAALAQDAATLDAVQVTATRIERPLDEALASVTVITREDIEASQAPDLIDLLGRQAGIDVARTGGPGAGSALFLRGSNSTQSLILVDGIRVTSTGQGVFDFAHLPLEQIERIEIVRGPRASMWGSDAIGGVVHVFTRDPSAPSARVTAGSYGRAGASAAFGTGDARRGFGITAGAQRVRGFSATNPNSVFSYDPDDDGYRNRNLSLRGRTAVGTLVLSFNAIATDAEVEFDRGITDARNASGGVTLAGELGARWSHQFTVGHAREDLDTVSSFSNAFRSRRTSADWLHTLAMGTDANLRFGLNWQRETGESENVFNGPLFDDTRRSQAAFVGYGGRFGRHVLDLSLRRDHSNQYGGVTTGNAGWGVDLGERVQWRLSWGQGFRAPNFNELYYPDTGFGFAGNPDLRPEHSRTWETGLYYAPAAGQRLELSVYRTRVRDLVAFAAPLTNNAININRAALEGVELGYRFDRGGWSGGGNLTWQDAIDAGTGRPLLRRAKRKAHVDLGHAWANGLSVALEGDYFSGRPDFGAQLPSHALAHLRLAWQFSPAWRLEGRLENLTDREYELVRGYNTPGRSGLVSLVWNGR
ncbi:TonB-dependent receptor domain-containing protein [Arenimonas sp.]|uniref:TonB-dependent receptor domain-containing protein n=1 Tax=Arenimonas sp. TaxID=1872635 RepID=UPI002E2F153E|nr:TonB-dependent receptor [Arenimonas sp.]HEX4852577.1 TonB-dependent receptor [Arenimonas sp.]